MAGVAIRPQKLVLRLVDNTIFRPVEKEIAAFIKVINSRLSQWEIPLAKDLATENQRPVNDSIH